MPTPELIADPADPRLAVFRDLTDAELRRGVEATGGRHGQGTFIVEGTLAINVLLARLDRWSVQSLLVTEKKLAEIDADGLQRSGAAVHLASQEVLNGVVGFDLHRGAVAAADRPPSMSPDDQAAEVLDRVGTAVVLEGITDQENLGVLFRNAAGLGAGVVLLSPTCCDPLYRRTVRVSMGHVLTTPFAHTAPLPGGLDALHERGFETVALTPAADAAPLDDLADTIGDRVAVLLGSEGPGLTPATMAAASHRARIPMARGVDSLNVAAAGAIAMHRLFGRPSRGTR